MSDVQIDAAIVVAICIVAVICWMFAGWDSL